jgi:raffinose/stachyose/melibiose transport system permease protein
MRSNSVSENSGYNKILLRRSGSVLVNIFLYGVCLTYIYPFFWLLCNSFKNTAQITLSTFRLPHPFTLYAYKTILATSGLYKAVFNSLFNTAVSLLFIVIFAFVIGYFLSRYSFKGRKFLYGFFLIGMLIPGAALTIPVYILFNKLGLLNTHFTLLFPYVTFGLPMSMFLYDSYVKTIPRSIEEAAFVDGASINKIMTSIMFPICRPITGTLIVLNFMSLWNEFAFALVLNPGNNYRTIPVWLTNFSGQYGSDMAVQIAGMLVGSLPIIIMYLFLREKMMEGLAAGAVKG